MRSASRLAAETAAFQQQLETRRWATEPDARLDEDLEKAHAAVFAAWLRHKGVSDERDG